jgi:hypothetical protein
VNLANLFEVDWSLCTDARAKSNDHWWRALKNFEFVAKINPTTSVLGWRAKEDQICPHLLKRADFRRKPEELAAYRFEVVRRVKNLSLAIWQDHSFEDRNTLISILGKTYDPPCLYHLKDFDVMPETTCDFTNIFWDVEQPDQALFHQFRTLVEGHRIRWGITPKTKVDTTGMQTTRPEWHLLELIDERYNQQKQRHIGRPPKNKPANLYSTEEMSKINNLNNCAEKWQELLKI